MKKILLFLLFFSVRVFGATDTAQWQQLANYEKATGKDRVIAANQLMQQLYDEDFNDNTVVFDPDISVDSLDRCIFFAATEYYFYALGDFNLAIQYAERTASLCHAAHDYATEGECESILGIAHFRRSEFAKALKHTHRDLAIQRHLGNTSNISSALNTLAGIYLATQQYEEAYKYISEAIPLSTAANDSSRMAIQMGMASEILQAMQRSEEALTYADAAYTLDSLCGNTNKAAIRLSQMTAALIDLGRLSEAESCLTQAIPVLRESHNWQSLAICHNQMGEILLRKGQLDAAADNYQKALDFFVRVGDYYNEAKAQKGLFKALKDDYPIAALRHLKRFSDLKDTLYSREIKQSISMAHAKYHNDELEYQNEQERTYKHYSIILAVVIVVALLILLGFVGYALRQRKHRLHLMRCLQEDKEQFFTNITHEFRTPLTIILGLSGRLKNGELNAEESPRSVGALIERQGNTLLELVNQLLAIARTGKVSVQADYRHGDVVGYLHMCVETCEELARQKHIALQYMPSETRVEMDFVPDYLCKILTNLLTNAIKFTPNYGNVRVTSRIASSQEDFVLRVEDNGVGIASDKLPTLFSNFVGEAGTNGEVSIGVGLVLVKKLVEALGGSIHVESVVGKGTTFEVRLPMAAVRSVPEDNAESVSADSQEKGAMSISERVTDEVGIGSVASSARPSILIVEDNPDIAYYVEQVLLRGNYDIAHAANGEEGLEKAKGLMPDLVITDVMMPKMDGFELCKRLKSSAVTNHIPVMVVTARTTEADKLHGIDCGAECYLYKPFSAEELFKRVHNIFEQRAILLEKVKKQFERAIDTAPTGGDKPLLNRLDDAFITKVNEFINAHMDQGGIDVDTLASHLCMSPKQFNRKLVHIVGSSAVNYMIKLRIARACRLLQTSDELISVIAQQCGFDNPSNFTRTFKDIVGCSPSAWRKKNML